jgi:hypothetical protein
MTMRSYRLLANRSRGTMALVFAVGLLASLPAEGQQTRAEELAAQQAEKAQHLTPYQPPPVERHIQRAERLLVDPPPVYPYIGSIMPGGLLALGPGYRQRLAATALFDVHGGWSLRNYKLVETSLTVPAVSGRINLRGEARVIDAPGVSFFGLGSDSRELDRAHFGFRTMTAGASVRVRPLAVVAAGGQLQYMSVTTTSGDVPQPLGAAAPGLAADPDYLVGGLFAEVDWRDAPGYSRKGGLYRAEWTRHAQRGDGPYSFDRFDGEVSQLVPLLRANWVLALRGLASVTRTDPGKAVPFFLMPELGGSRVLRGYAPWRFRDEHRMLLSGEYRWTAGQFVDMALFLDAGKVVARRRDLDFDGLKTSYGIGVRFHTPVSTPLRIELARTGDGLALVFGFGPSF